MNLFLKISINYNIVNSLTTALLKNVLHLHSVWAKVQEAFKEFGEKVKAKSEAIWKKLGPAAMKVLGKYKDVIIDALEKDGKVIIVEGRKIVITIINDVVKVVIDAIDALTGEKTVPTAGGKGGKYIT